MPLTEALEFLLGPWCLRSGEETSGEAARFNANQSSVAQQIHNERVNNGGALNRQQKRQINKEQNANSRQIYKQKHNNATVPPPDKHEK